MVSSTHTAEVIKLKFANYFPPTHMNSVMMGKYCEELNRKLIGKAEVTQYASNTLLSAPKMAAGIAVGIADIGLSNRWTLQWNKIEIEEKDFTLKQGAQIVTVPDADSPEWIKAVQPVIDNYKKDLVAKGPDFA